MALLAMRTLRRRVILYFDIMMRLRGAPSSASAIHHAVADDSDAAVPRPPSRGDMRCEARGSAAIMLSAALFIYAQKTRRDVCEPRGANMRAQRERAAVCLHRDAFARHARSVDAGAPASA